MSCVLTVQGSLTLHEELKKFIFIIKEKILSCVVYPCFFGLNTLPLPLMNGRFTDQSEVDALNWEG